MLRLLLEVLLLSLRLALLKSELANAFLQLAQLLGLVLGLEYERARCIIIQVHVVGRDDVAARVLVAHGLSVRRPQRRRLQVH